ncbi:MAG TPA: LON peptidase substrate-binding domain-containing protein [Planctomycetia bacterium]|nr:LON peptidase substrate-binding domain-containing protein [Planctomycetia bacterium]
MAQTRIALFPLDGVALFPGGLLPLHIFEPRYRQMTEDALAADRMFAMAIPSGDAAFDPAPIHPVVCLGEILRERRLADGRFKFILRGEARMRIERELPMCEKLYRSAWAVPLPDRVRPGRSTARGLQRSFLLGQLERMLPEANEAALELYRRVRDARSDGAFADLLAYAAPLPAGVKRDLLCNPQVDERLELLAESLPPLVADLEPPSGRRDVSPN